MTISMIDAWNIILTHDLAAKSFCKTGFYPLSLKQMLNSKYINESNTDFERVQRNTSKRFSLTSSILTSEEMLKKIEEYSLEKKYLYEKELEKKANQESSLNDEKKNQNSSINQQDHHIFNTPFVHLMPDFEQQFAAEYLEYKKKRQEQDMRMSKQLKESAKNSPSINKKRKKATTPIKEKDKYNFPRKISSREIKSLQ
ncbi:hypothetical protein TVAG_484490 [Trichomonas vaginalis G3]|uniref:Uncharacterized protein n=1 Tax=Trichomonas vaginalis (strain ATCC PRA-98 / G3) TaxID=412133 RepID=A2F1X7_TRIV3|nr:hypothetical protein TVAGG3_0128680 [Trichomonas vaginalis G3]EAY01075.1 hypothetical protein TVAG_484490 [Trichomonas vaginalis G3]KAI5545942.1 hypothetical protein TVAGG3_0128680 [Trichomonas vaginalis G3]|eukprot:XP_001313943.1 hypothetical protein [Trichomonas vaginalis G3]